MITILLPRGRSQIPSANPGTNTNEPTSMQTAPKRTSAWDWDLVICIYVCMCISSIACFFTDSEFNTEGSAGLKGRVDVPVGTVPSPEA